MPQKKCVFEMRENAKVLLWVFKSYKSMHW